MHLLPVGRDAVLVEVGSSAEAVSLAAWARDHRLATDVVPGAATVLLDGAVDRDRLPDLLASWRHDYNHVRPHSAHGGLPPATAGERLRNPDQLRRSPARPAVADRL